MYILAGFVSILIYESMRVDAHYPCDYVEQKLDCHYVQVVNPLTGKLEQQFICE